MDAKSILKGEEVEQHSLLMRPEEVIRCNLFSGIVVWRCTQLLMYFLRFSITHTHIFLISFFNAQNENEMQTKNSSSNQVDKEKKNRN